MDLRYASVAMRHAVISDIHANLEAFRQVLADIDTQNADRIISLGDNVGYGPDPEGVIELVREREIPSVLGNHEHGIINPARRNWFNFVAREALEITMSLLSQESKNHIATMPTKIVEPNYHFVHGFPPESAHTYLFAQDEIKLLTVFSMLPAEIFFIGHTHMLELITYDGRGCEREDIWQGTTELLPTNRYMVNVGSVGQPRDHDPHAKYVIWDDQARTLEVRFVEYDVAKTADKIIKLGIPETYATRLYG